MATSHVWEANYGLLGGGNPATRLGMSCGRTLFREPARVRMCEPLLLSPVRFERRPGPALTAAASVAAILADITAVTLVQRHAHAARALAPSWLEHWRFNLDCYWNSLFKGRFTVDQAQRLHPGEKNNCHIGHRARVALLLALAWHLGQKVAPEFTKRCQLAQFHCHPGRITDPHVD